MIAKKGQALKMYAEWAERIDDAQKIKQVDGAGNAAAFVVGQLLGEINLQIWRRDKAGKLLLDDAGRPLVDWVAVLTGLGRLVGKIIALMYAYQKGLKMP